MDQLFDTLVVWIWICDPTILCWNRNESADAPRTLIEYYCIASEGGLVNMRQLPVEYGADAVAQIMDRTTRCIRRPKGVI